MSCTLLIDVGNTRLKWGLWDGTALSSPGSLPTSALGQNEVSALLEHAERAAGVSVANVAGADAADAIKALFSAMPGLRLTFAETAASFGMLRNAYAAPDTMGVDRWLAMVAAWGEVADACVVIDAGTAVTIDAIRADGQHLGGQILPGAPLMIRALAGNTGRLPAIDHRPPTSGVVFAASTAEAIRNGVWSAVLGAVERSLAELPDATLVLTGGDAPFILNMFNDTRTLSRPCLVLEGLAASLESAP